MFFLSLINDHSESALLILCAVLIVAFLYSSVGHGGASGYLALMAVVGISPLYMRPSALMLNVFVAGIAFFQFYHKGHFIWKLFFPFAIGSVPLSFVGATINIDPQWYMRILGICLFIAALRILNIIGSSSQIKRRDLNFVTGLLFGCFIGFLSGMLGIGGGIILSPIILLFKWGNIKETAAVSALFIFVNSISGLIGLLYSGATFNPKMFTWVVIAVIGGIAGSYVGSSKLDTTVLKKVLAVVLLLASIKLVFI